MSNSDDNSGSSSGAAWRSGGGINARPHAYDPRTQPELFSNLLSRRVIAFLIDLVILSIPVLIAAIFIFVFGIVTLTVGWLLYGLLWPATVVWAIVYYGTCFGGPHSATVGMRTMDLQMRTWYGEPCYFLLGAIHGVLFWVSVSMLTPFVLLVGLFNNRSRLLHDMVTGTVVINRARSVEIIPPER